MMVTLDQAIELAAGLLDLSDQLADDFIASALLGEYVRGMANILAELYPVIEMPHAERSDEIEKRIWKIAESER